MIRPTTPTILSDRQRDGESGEHGGGGALLPDSVAIVCLCHLRWDFVFQRPQHLLSRFAKRHRVYVVEEPIHDVGITELRLRREGGLTIVVPHLPPGLGEQTEHELLRSRLTRLLADEGVDDFALWYYTPMALPFSDHLAARVEVYDCMDELSAFRGAPPEMLTREADLIARSDLVFTGGLSLYEAKRDRHHNVHAFPSSIEYQHFATARGAPRDPADQAGIPGPRIGFYGVVDERFDADLLGQVASARPDWQFVIIGPVVKIDPATLPCSANVHYLGQKGYQDLPAYLSGWDVAILPFARNESTRFISPTKTPEYLAAGRPVVSTPITDVVRPYGDEALVHIAEDAEAWVGGIEKALAQRSDARWLARVDAHLAGNSWDETWARMSRLMAGSLHACASTAKA